MAHLTPAPHSCAPKNGPRVARALSEGYFEAYHTSSAVLGRARAAVLERTGYQTLLEEAGDGWIVLARATETLDPHGGDEA